MMCVSLRPGSNEEALARMRDAYRLVDIVELRIDGIRRVDLNRLLKWDRKKVIVTNRSREEGGLFAGSGRERMELLQQAVSLGAEYVDVELKAAAASGRDIPRIVHGGGSRTRLILSWHDMSGTPSVRALRGKLDQGFRNGADIVKVVPYATMDEDNLKILDLILYGKKMGRDVIAFCMGNCGRISRVLTPLLGSCISYVSLTPEERTAPGQLTVADMQQLMTILTDHDGKTEHNVCPLR